MMVQTSMQMNEDGSSYTNVLATVQNRELQSAVKAISDEGIMADVSYRIARYMGTETDGSMQNPDMPGYFIGGKLAECYAVGIATEHFQSLCEENNINYAKYDGRPDHGILISSTRKLPIVWQTRDSLWQLMKRRQHWRLSW